RHTRFSRDWSSDVCSSDLVQKYVAWGAGPRASQNLILAAKARAILHGRFAAEREDVRALAKPVLRHRIQVNFSAEAEGIRSEDEIGRASCRERRSDAGEAV